jgi:hypothetical protein
MTAATVLPGGWLDPAGVCRQDAVVRPLRGRDEEWLYGLAPSTPQASIVTDLLLRCVARIGGMRVRRDVVRALSVGDRDYLVLAVLRTTFGDRLALVLNCAGPACGARMDVDLPLDAVPVHRRPVRPSYPCRPEAAGEVLFRLPTGGDLEDVARWAAGRPPADAARALLVRCVLSVDGDSGRAADEALRSPALCAAVEAEIERVSPRVESEVEAACPECGEPLTFEFDPTAALLGEAFRRRAELHQDVHLLGLYYHWPLREILGLARNRRKAYLAFLTGQVGAGTPDAAGLR